MGLKPTINQRPTFTLRKCTKCGNSFGADAFAPTHSFLFTDGYLPICNTCIDNYIGGNQDDENWTRVNKMCQLSDIPFVPSEWEKIYQCGHAGAFTRYSIIFMKEEYKGIDWSTYYEKYQELIQNGELEKELPLLNEQRHQAQVERWGGNYDQESLDYLDRLFNGLITTQNVNGALQMDQALKICKLSYDIDQRIRAGEEFDKVLTAYDKLVKTAEFTPKNVKNVNDFDTIGELIKWLEKRGWHNEYYDDVSKDIVDETIANIQNFNRRLYTNESGIGEDITHRIEMLEKVNQLENSGSHYLEENQTYDLERYDNQAYEDLMIGDEFNPDIGGDDNAI